VVDLPGNQDVVLCRKDVVPLALVQLLSPNEFYDLAQIAVPQHFGASDVIVIVEPPHFSEYRVPPGLSTFKI
jgi:hypothetical protein